MGYRLHYAQHYDPQWMGGYFNHDFASWERLFYAKFVNNGWKGEESDQYEVERKDIQAYIDEIKDSPRDFNEYFKGYKNEQIVDTLEEILGSDDDLIRIEWS